MAHSTAYREIGKYVDTYILKKILPQDDYFVYLQHSCDCFRKINTHHNNKVVTTKVTSSTLGIIEWPGDMVGFSNLFVPISGEWWSFSRSNRKITTTTTVLGVETQDSEIGEGVNTPKDISWGINGKGGVNDFSATIDFSARRIFCDNFKSQTAVLQYTSNGLVINGSTYIDSQCEIVIDKYLDWQREIINPRSIAMLDRLGQYYKDELFDLRKFNFMPSKDEIADAWDSSSTQGIQR